jgi:hypothetical protein
VTELIVTVAVVLGVVFVDNVAEAAPPPRVLTALS